MITAFKNKLLKIGLEIKDQYGNPIDLTNLPVNVKILDENTILKEIEVTDHKDRLNGITEFELNVNDLKTNKIYELEIYLMNRFKIKVEKLLVKEEQ